jgi:hypothetical protein
MRIHYTDQDQDDYDLYDVYAWQLDAELYVYYEKTDFTNIFGIGQLL